ncbi:hypothetical protein BCR44DRAFT_1052795 [Catenaria anguillulae PL171]|uniref:Uncharacterized protein n=1 Tax=Catenaria anguillulae PL171 TaxID=765915 RepID=A0A1Y2HTT5_9FUNG|nr:hypothetical protein BCR44DRAFT_1052795 [Catenaria anguillulae PL171]
MLGIQQFRQPRACLKLPQKLQFQLTHHLKAKLTLSHAPLGFTGKVVGDATWSSDKIMTKYAAGIEAKQWTPIQLRVVTSHRSKCWHGCFQRGSTTNSPPTIHMSKDVVLDRNRGGLLWPLQAKKNLPAPDPLRSRQTWLPCNVRYLVPARQRVHRHAQPFRRPIPRRPHPHRNRPTCAHANSSWSAFWPRRVAGSQFRISHMERL